MNAEAYPVPSLRQTVLLERIGHHVALVTLNRSEAGNAINGVMTKALDAVVQETESDPDIWAVVLTGSGEESFCAGADLKEIAAGRGVDLVTPNGGFAGFVFAKRCKPWIAAVNGKAAGGGFEIALACDLIVASDAASFALPEVSRGLVATAGGVIRLPRYLPRAIALEAIVTGSALSAQRAATFGLVNRVVPVERLLYESLALARRITNNAPLAVRESLHVARQVIDLSEQELKELTHERWMSMTHSNDFKEGARAMIEQRTPRWTGT